MRLAPHRQLDALCGEYLLGTLRGGARRRFERALREEPLVALRLKHWQRMFMVRYSEQVAERPAAGGWARLERELDLARYRTRWWQRTGFWRGWAIGATAALVLAISVNLLRPTEPTLNDVARLAGTHRSIPVTVPAPAESIPPLPGLTTTH